MLREEELEEARGNRGASSGVVLRPALVGVELLVRTEVDVSVPSVAGVRYGRHGASATTPRHPVSGWFAASMSAPARPHRRARRGSPLSAPAAVENGPRVRDVLPVARTPRPPWAGRSARCRARRRGARGSRRARYGICTFQSREWRSDEVGKSRNVGRPVAVAAPRRPGRRPARRSLPRPGNGRGSAPGGLGGDAHAALLSSDSTKSRMSRLTLTGSRACGPWPEPSRSTSLPRCRLGQRDPARGGLDRVLGPWSTSTGEGIWLERACLVSFFTGAGADARGDQKRPASSRGPSRRSPRSASSSGAR